MKANVGDWLVVHGHTVDQPERRARIVGVGEGGAPPFTVHWLEDDHTGIVFPGPDARVVTAAELEELDRRQAERVTAVQSSIQAHSAAGPA